MTLSRYLHLAPWATAFAGAHAENMNGLYTVASGTRQNVSFNTDYASKGHEYFDVYSDEIATHYGEVFWTSLPPVSLPEDIISRFRGKVMAVTGYEADQVMESPEGDVSVPISWAYNHHYVSWMTGQYSEMNQVPADPHDTMNHGAPFVWKALEKPEAASRTTFKDVPTSQIFSEGNGGEMRKSFHGYPKGYAQLIHSPDTFKITPMQIDTRNRDCGANYTDVSKCLEFTPGPEPRSARFFRGIPNGTLYSGLLECPCTSRFGGDYGDRTKIVEHDYQVITSRTCSGTQQIVAADQCFDSVASLKLGQVARNFSVTDTAVPAGCFFVTHSRNGTVDAYFNDKPSSVACGGGDHTATLAGSIRTDVGTSLRVKIGASSVELTLSGPAEAWYGFGFHADTMKSQPYAIVVNSTGVMERKLGTLGDVDGHNEGKLLESSLTVLSNTVINGQRTVIASRALAGKTQGHYSFSTSTDSIHLITAVGASQAFAHHRANSIATVSLAAADVPNCVCDAGVSAQLCFAGGKGCTKFTKDCENDTPGSLGFQRNPSCSSLTYHGGLHCCIHGNVLLDADQPDRPELLRYRIKFRFWFQDYSETPRPSHENLDRIFIQTEANSGEYDVPPAFAPAAGYPNWPAGKMTPGTNCTGTCPDGADCVCHHTITHKWTMDNVRLIYASAHCHAATCISMELYNADTMELLCRVLPVYGKGDVKNNRFDEKGYLFLPPCLFGSPDPAEAAQEGLEPSRFFKSITFLSVKKSNNTGTGHYGDMAMWQMRSVSTPGAQVESFI
eukprot:gb/GFBE01038957.1/.p1 GENE.gb/GFBE01038957.1/~~gb/GFBE01038957.1/.p1  ORF type:complete len:785 (+),score=142.22 gb/GFBE01038957.1/:1-2355(+)